MKVKELIPQVDNRTPFSLKFNKFLPKKDGCYILATFDDEVLYVGLTENLHRRFAAHRKTKEKLNLTSQGKTFWFYYLPCDKRDLQHIERGWLNQHVMLHGVFPIFNKIYSPVR